MNDNSELMPNETLGQNEILVGERLYSDAINIVLANAHHELLIFDQDLTHGDFISVQKYELLREFLSKDINSRLTIILQNTTFFQEKCPRLVSLLTVYGHKMTIYETNDSAKHAKDCFVLADDKHYIKRIHIDQARFKYALDDPASVDVLNLRFNELLEATHHMVTITKLGL
ncbi:MAG TPA: hypothetical protein VK967_04700 [Methylotenera sp.]|nr:hypothetical protein [Methylotenera sp.]